jgi:hypothetical protein
VIQPDTLDADDATHVLPLTIRHLTAAAVPRSFTAADSARHRRTARRPTVRLVSAESIARSISSITSPVNPAITSAF